MLIRDNFRHQFYEVVKRKVGDDCYAHDGNVQHVFLVVACDVDALCAARILMSLLECDHVTYTVVAVSGWDELTNILEGGGDQSRQIILINCGGSRSLLDLNLAEGMIIYVLDSRRPFHLDNVFDNETVRLLVENDAMVHLNCPRPGDIYASDSEEDDEEEKEEEGEGRRTIEQIERRVRKKEQRARWRKRREEILWEYYENDWTSNSGSSELLWCAVAGLSSQLADGLISQSAYNDICMDKIRPYVWRFRQETVGNDQLRISFDKEIPLPLYAHWSLYQSMSHDQRIICSTRLWTQSGEATLKQRIAQLGLTLRECEQLFSALNLARKKEVLRILEKEVDSIATYSAHWGYGNRFSSADFARALAVHLETSIVGIAVDQRFCGAMQILGEFLGMNGAKRSTSPLLNAINHYKSVLQTVVRHALGAVNQTLILPTGPFYLLCLTQATETNCFLSRHCLFTFVRLVLHAFVTAGRKNRRVRPLIVAVQLGVERPGWYCITGAMPLDTYQSDSRLKSFLGRAFDRVAQRLNLDLDRTSFDSTVVFLRSEDRARFFDGLQAILELD